jgi:hypothetical protein
LNICLRCGYTIDKKSSIVTHIDRKKICKLKFCDINVKENKHLILERLCGICKKCNKMFENLDDHVCKTKKRKKLPANLRIQVWSECIGMDIGECNCECCNVNKISQFNFEAGHRVSVFNGGLDTLDNLVPICSMCNRSMGTMNFDDYMLI